MHGLAWRPNTSNVEVLLSSPNDSDAARESIIQYADSIISTWNPSVLPDGSNKAAPKTHPCS